MLYNFSIELEELYFYFKFIKFILLYTIEKRKFCQKMHAILHTNY